MARKRDAEAGRAPEARDTGGEPHAARANPCMRNPTGAGHTGSTARLHFHCYITAVDPYYARCTPTVDAIERGSSYVVGGTPIP